MLALLSAHKASVDHDIYRNPSSVSVAVFVVRSTPFDAKTRRCQDSQRGKKKRGREGKKGKKEEKG
jgi:hypothetical protein